MMECIVGKLQKQGVLMALFLWVLLHTGCEEHFDRSTVNPSEGEMVEVSLNIGFADEADAASLPSAPATKSNQAADKQAAFDMQLQPATQTKTITTTNRPDKLYNLDIHQYKIDGTHLASFTVGTIDLGTAITSTLIYNSGAECQLLIIARGETGAVASLSSKSLSQVKAIMANSSTISGVDPSSGTNINNMPYLLFLPKVKISSGGKLISPEDTDVRLLLKRLAVGLTIDWTFSSDMTNKGYSLTEVRLMQLPKDYRILPERETVAPYGEMYPTSVSEFVDGFRLKGAALTTAGGKQTLWMPANARGVRNDINSPNQRSKEKAHSAATYIEFVVDNSSKNERLLYRAYLGGNATTDFNLLENTNYHWTLNINNANYTTDNRIQLLDQTPVKSDNLQPTANCFMMRPGTDISFNPYKHEAGVNGQNTYLTDKTITKVEVLWQSKDAGTSGDLVLGYAGKDDQKNLVNYTQISDPTNARVHVKVANTQGGNAVIAAYNASNAIVWSWHLWISDYVPARINNSAINSSTAQTTQLNTARAASVGGTVHQYGGAAWTYNTGNFYDKVIMDRALGALRNTYSETNALESARAYGNLYQWGRKDPMPGSADGGRDDVDLMFDGDGVSKLLDKKSNGTLDLTIQYPDAFYKSLALPSGWDSGNKSIYDPCPSGWKIPDFQKTVTAKNIFANFSWSTLRMLTALGWGNQNVSISQNIFNIRNGMEYTTPAGDKAWFPFFRMRELGTGLLRDPYRNNQTGGDTNFSNGMVPAFTMYGAAHVSGKGYYVEFKYAPPANDYGQIDKPYGFSIRCVQDNKDGK